MLEFRGPLSYSLKGIRRIPLKWLRFGRAHKELWDTWDYLANVISLWFWSYRSQSIGESGSTPRTYFMIFMYDTALYSTPCLKTIMFQSNKVRYQSFKQTVNGFTARGIAFRWHHCVHQPASIGMPQMCRGTGVWRLLVCHSGIGSFTSQHGNQ